MKRRFIRLVFGFLALLPLCASAVVVDGLYEVKVPVLGQNQSEREEAVRAAFSRLLVRITGTPEVLNREVTQTLLQKAAQFVQQYRYQLVPAASGNGTETETQVLNVVFDAAATDQALWANGLPVWGRTRPATLVWLAVQESETRYLLDANNPSQILGVLQERAVDRGLPLVFPLLDLEDRFRVSVSDVWANFNEPIQEASKRYDTEAVLVGRVFQDIMGGWQARWTVYEGKNVTAWSSQGEDLEAVVGEGVDGVANELASRYANIGGREEGALSIAVADVATVDDYVRTTRYLESLTPVEAVQVVTIEPARITYRLQLRGSQEGLAQAINLGNTLALDQIDIPEPGNGLTLAYRLLP